MMVINNSWWSIVVVTTSGLEVNGDQSSPFPKNNSIPRMKIKS